MVAGIFTLGTPIWEIALRSAVVYLGSWRVSAGSANARSDSSRWPIWSW
jgi:hypothetical protein